MKNRKELVFTVQVNGVIRVTGKVYDTYGFFDEVDYTVQATNTQEAYEKVFGIGSYSPHQNDQEDKYKDDPYLAFLRET